MEYLIVPTSDEDVITYPITVDKETFEKIQEICKKYDCRLVEDNPCHYRIAPNWIEEEPEYELL